MPDEQCRKLVKLIARDPSLIRILDAVRALDLPDGWVVAGVIRNRVWDHLHGYPEPTPPNDIDVVYHDPDHLDEAAEKRLDAALQKHLPVHPWSVKNQARMALQNGDPPYRSVGHALLHWCETATSVAARLGSGGAIEVLAPLGLDDLFGLIARPTPFALAHAHKLAQYRARMARKNWPRRWPMVRVLGL